MPFTDQLRLAVAAYLARFKGRLATGGSLLDAVPWPWTAATSTGPTRALARYAADGRDLDETFFHSHRNARLSVRWVYVHMIEEYARHNSHADLLREHIDGATGL